MQATGTDSKDRSSTLDITSLQFAAELAPNSGNSGQTVSFAVISSADAYQSLARPMADAIPKKSSKKASSTTFVNQASEIGMTGFEPATSTSRT
jgi:hypothetical protein